MRFILKFKLAILFAIIVMPILAFASPDVPPIYDEILNANTLAAVIGVIGAVEILLNMIKVKGFLAVLVTIFASMIFSITQYGLGPGQITFGLIVGVLAALSFYLSKNVGDVTASLGLANAEGKKSLIGKVFGFVSSHQGLLVTVAKALKYIVFRK